MIRRWTAHLLACAAAFLMAGCVSLEQMAPPVEQLSASAATVGNLRLGREIYVTRCTKCHSAEPVRRYSSDDWQNDIIPEMAAKTKLNSAETAALRGYIFAVLGTPPTR